MQPTTVPDLADVFGDDDRPFLTAKAFRALGTMVPAAVLDDEVLIPADVVSLPAS